MSIEALRGLMNSTKDIERAVRSYIDTSDTMYAIMVDGEWGCGKTYLWKNIIRPIVGKDEALYISLFGLKDIKDIDNEIFKAMSFVGDDASGFFKGLLEKSEVDISDDIKLGGIGFAAQYGMKKWKETRLKKSKELFICFDDLERWSGDIEVCLSYINKLVEHDGTKCLIIGNSREIKEEFKNKFNATKDKTIGFKYKLTHDPKDVFEAALTLTKYTSEESRTTIENIYKNNEARISADLVESNCFNIRIVSTAISYLDKIVANNLEKFRLSETASIDYFTSLISIVILVEMYRTSDEDKKMMLDAVRDDAYGVVEELGLGPFCKVDGEKQSEEDDIIERLLYKGFSGIGAIKRKGICSIVKNGFYREEDFVDEFSDWKKPEDYEIYLDTFKAWYMSDEDEKKIFGNTYRSVFEERKVKIPHTLLLIADRMTNDIKRGVLDLDFEELKNSFRTLFSELYDGDKMERVDRLDFSWGIEKFVYCKDIHEEVEERNKKYIEGRDEFELSNLWVNLKKDPSAMDDLLDKYQDSGIFALYESPNDILDSLEILSNSQLFEFTRWIGSRVANQECLSAVNSEHARAKGVVSAIQEKYGKKYGVRAGHFKQIARVLKNRTTDYDPDYIKKSRS